MTIIDRLRVAFLVVVTGTGLSAAATSGSDHRRVEIVSVSARKLGRGVLHAVRGAAERLGVVPGRQTTRLDALHPRFRPRVARVVARLEGEGHEVRVASVWRSPERQDAIYAVSRLAERLGGSPGTRVRGGASCHNQSSKGEPASAAIDLRGARGLSRDAEARFFHALGEAARAEGLRWGGDWTRSNPIWARRGLGWDPGHIEDRSLCRALRR